MELNEVLLSDKEQLLCLFERELVRGGRCAPGTQLDGAQASGDDRTITMAATIAAERHDRRDDAQRG